MNRAGTAGIEGKDVRSDCFVRYEDRKSFPCKIEIESKVKSIYGKELQDLAEDVLSKLGIKNGILEIMDYGALPFVLSARIESAIKSALPEVKKSYLPEPYKPATSSNTDRERLRRSRLYIPGNSPKFMPNSALYKSDGIILDLEDSVAPSAKDEARILVRNVLLSLDFSPSERMVRINPPPIGFKDIDEISGCNVHVILIPKCESASDVSSISRYIRQKSNKPIFLMPIIESAKGGINAYEIATASPEIVALTLGLEDYTADIGVQRTKEGKESFWVRSEIVNAAKAAGVQAIDTVFSDVGDMEGLRESVLEAKSLGFEGKGCIHPRQIPVVHEAFAPTEKEIERAKKIKMAYDEAVKKGLGVVSLGTKMIDPPVVKRALKTIELAKSMGII